MKKLLALTLAGAALSGAVSCQPSDQHKPTVIVYGDSLAVSSEGALRFWYGDKYNFVYKAKSGTALCDPVAGMALDRAVYKPAQVVVAYTGNVATGCIEPAWQRYGVTGATGNYETALRTVAAAYKGLPVTVMSPPAMHNLGWYWFNGDAHLVSMYQRVSTELGLHDSTLADEYLTPGHNFRWCGPRFWTGKQVQLRTTIDGVHLTPEGQTWYAQAIGASIKTN